MLVCLVCPKHSHLPPAHDDLHHHSTLAKSPPPTKENIKSFTTQLKDIVMKFSTGAYRHCRPCTAQGGAGAAAHDQSNEDDDEEDEKSSIFLAASNSDQAFSDQMLASPTHVHQFGVFSPTRYDLLPTARRRGHRHHKKSKRSASCTGHVSSTNKLLHDGSNNNISNPSLLFNRSSTPSPRPSGSTTSRQPKLKQLSSDLGPPDLSEHLLLEQLSRDQLLDEQLISREQEQEQEQQKLLQLDGHHDHENNSNNIVEAGKYTEEWVAQVEPGVMITFVALPDGSNHLKRIRFSQELFSKWQAQLWWADNSDMVHELYSVTRSEAPNCDSPRSSSSTSSSRQEDALRNTPEMLSRVGSGQISPSRTSATTTLFNAAALDLLLPSENARLSTKSGACTAMPSQLPVNCVIEEGFAQISEHHHHHPENHDRRYELGSGLGHIHNEGMRSPLNMDDSPEAVQGGLWTSVDEGLAGVYVNLLQEEEEEEEEEEGHDDDHNALAGGLRELKRVRFIRQPPN